MEDDTIETILGTVASVLEEHNKILLYHRQNIERLFGEIAKIKQILDTPNSPDAPSSTDTEFIKSMTARLQALSKTIDEKKL